MHVELVSKIFTFLRIFSVYDTWFLSWQNKLKGTEYMVHLKIRYDFVNSNSGLLQRGLFFIIYVLGNCFAVKNSYICIFYTFYSCKGLIYA